MDSIRSVIETLKWLSFTDVLRCSEISSFFLKVSHTSEIWVILCERHNIDLRSIASKDIAKVFRENFLRSNFVFLIFPKHQHIFNCEANKWAAKKSVQLPVAAWNAAYVVVGTEVMVTGGGTPSSWKVFLYSPFKERFTELESMLKPRAGHGLAYYEGVVYAFGGCTSKKTCEMYCDGEWSLMRDMKTEHAWFTAAVLKSLIYLCGGMTTACEAFNPATQLCSLIAYNLPEESEACTCVYRGKLVVVQRTSITKLGGKRVKKVGQPPLGAAWTNMQPVVVGDRAYLPRQDNDCVRAVWLSTLNIFEVIGWS